MVLFLSYYKSLFIISMQIHIFYEWIPGGYNKSKMKTVIESAYIANPEGIMISAVMMFE